MANLINAKAREWIDALRSGKYEQGRSYLCAGNKFCCLGVAEDLAGTEYTTGKKGVNSVRLYRDPYYEWGNMRNATDLTENTETALGLNPGAQKKLARMNDGGATFARIAEELESNQEKYFSLTW